MSLAVCTGWSGAGWEQYGRRFAETFDRCWPSDVELIVVGEEPRELPNTSGRKITFRPLEVCRGLTEFLYRHAQDREAAGRKPENWWKERAKLEGYNWRMDALKFCRQAFIPYFAASYTSARYLCWLDGDVVTHRRLDEETITSLLPDGYHVAFLGREPKHPDIAFQLYDLSTTTAHAMIDGFRSYYNTDRFRTLDEWHSAYVWRTVMRECEASGLGGFWNMTPRGSGHVWHQSPLAWWGDHLKGKRKDAGRSPERRA